MNPRPETLRPILAVVAALALLTACQRETLLDLEVEGEFVTPDGTYPVVWTEADHPSPWSLELTARSPKLRPQMWPTGTNRWLYIAPVERGASLDLEYPDEACWFEVDGHPVDFRCEVKERSNRSALLNYDLPSPLASLAFRGSKIHASRFADVAAQRDREYRLRFAWWLDLQPYSVDVTYRLGTRKAWRPLGFMGAGIP